MAPFWVASFVALLVAYAIGLAALFYPRLNKSASLAAEVTGEVNP